jgi:hypothetical protein
MIRTYEFIIKIDLRIESTLYTVIMQLRLTVYKYSKGYKSLIGISNKKNGSHF